MLVRWGFVVVLFVYILGALGTFLATITDDKFLRRERYVIAAGERSLLWPAKVPEIVSDLLDD